MYACMNATLRVCACRWRDGYSLEHDPFIWINTYRDMYMHVFMYEHARTLSLSAASAPSDSRAAAASSLFAHAHRKAVIPSYMCVCMHECVQVSLRGILTHTSVCMQTCVFIMCTIYITCIKLVSYFYHHVWIAYIHYVRIALTSCFAGQGCQWARRHGRACTQTHLGIYAYIIHVRYIWFCMRCVRMPLCVCVSTHTRTHTHTHTQRCITCTYKRNM
jgi:hypothetical protein